MIDINNINNIDEHESLALMSDKCEVLISSVQQKMKIHWNEDHVYYDEYKLH